MNPFDFRVSLRLHHPAMDPDEITSKLNMTPRFKWKAGEKRVTAKGTALDGFRESSYWYSNLVRHPDETLSDALRENLKALEPAGEFLDHFCRTGGSIEYFIGWFSASNSGETFDWELLQKLAQRRISLALDVYGAEIPSVPARE
jgi:hypothetical protein